MLVLHVDDQLTMPLALRRALSKQCNVPIDYRSVRHARALHELLALLTTGPDAILLDYDMGHAAPNGIELLVELRKGGLRAPIIVLSGHEDPRLMSLAMQSGANDYLSKADPLDTLAASVLRAIERSAREGPQNGRAAARSNEAGIVGETMAHLKERLARVIQLGVSPLLVQGESGTGKEQVAHLIECLLRSEWEGRPGAPVRVPFVRVNCATLQNDTIESELFGHERGAFTGADKSKIGLFESAHGGWIFLDEVAKLSTRAQASLLRTLETGEIRPLGSNQTKTVQVRVLAATNEDLDHLAQTGMFRQDLLERLRAYTIELPPLRQRSLTERSELLAHLLERLAHAMKVQSPFKLDAAAHKMILAAPFRKSNIREMWNVLQSAAVDAQDGCITVACLPKSFLAEQCDGVHQHGEVHGTDVPLGGSRGELLCAKHGPFAVGDFPGDPSLSEVAEGLKRLGYEGYEMHFFATVLQRLVHEAPEHTRSIRSLANKLRMGRHLVTRKVLALRDLGMLPHGLGHLFSFGVGKQHGIPNSEQSVEESN